MPPIPAALADIANCLAPLRVGVCCIVLAAVGCGGSVVHISPTGNSTGESPTQPQQMGTVTISPQTAALSTGQNIRFSAAVPPGGAVTWSVNGSPGGGPSDGVVDAAGNYTAPAVSQSRNIVVRAAMNSAPQSNFATATVALIQPGQVEATANPQVALYTVNLPQKGTVSVQFGTDTRYGLNTWAQSTPSDSGGAVAIQVAGMRGATTYHLQAQVTLANGTVFRDGDHSFTTGAAPPTSPLVISRPSGLPPQPGIELFDTVEFGAVPYDPKLAQAFATDLEGNVIWTYRYTGSPANVITPIKLLPNGHFLVVLTVTSGPTNSTIPPGTVNDVREIDLVGNTIHDLSMEALNQSLASAGYTGMTLFAFSRDVLALPNGHFVFLAQMAKAVQNLAGYPGTTRVAGDVLVDVDQNYKPVWVWSSFDHLDVNRHPFQFPPDWTHSDALLYSADDHDLLLSIRNQNWIVKIDYRDAAGSGDVLWHLGIGGDFKLVGGVEPTDWFYAQHGINFIGSGTSGTFELTMIDDGDDRQFSQGVVCGSSGAPPCEYSTVPVLRIDESAMTATMQHHYVAPAAFYSFFGGQADGLPNGDIEVDFCAAKAGAAIQEYQPGAAVTETAPSIVWQAVSPGYDQYRAMRIASLYPGVQW